MRMRRGSFAVVCLGALLAMIAALGAGSAPAATASWEFDTSEYEFAPAPYGSGPIEPHAFTLTNTGETAIAAKTWGLRFSTAWPNDSSPFLVTSSLCQNRTLEPGESCSLEVAFEPHHAGPVHGAVMFKSQNAEVPIVAVELRGEGTGPSLPMTPQHLAFGPVAAGKTTAPQTITVEEQSATYAYRLEHIFLTPPGELVPPSGPFQIVGGSCHEGIRLDPEELCTIEVVMAPTAAGSFQSQVEVTDQAPESPQTVELEGTATPAPAPTDPAPIPGIGAGITPIPPVSPPTAPVKRACPRGKRKVVRKNRHVCVTRTRHHRHPTVRRPSAGSRP